MFFVEVQPHTRYRKRLVEARLPGCAIGAKPQIAQQIRNRRWLHYVDGSQRKVADGANELLKLTQPESPNLIPGIY